MKNFLNKGDVVKTSISNSTIVLEIEADKALLYGKEKYVVAYGVQKKGDKVIWDHEEYYDELPEKLFKDIQTQRLKLEEKLVFKGFNSPYNIDEFNIEQLNHILKGLELGIDVSKYAKPEIKGWEMKEAWKNLSIEKNVEKTTIELLKKDDYSWSQKLEIIKGCRVSPSIAKLYADTKLSWKQMKEIRLEWTEKYYDRSYNFDYADLDIDLNSYKRAMCNEEDIKKRIEHERQCEEKAKDILSKNNFGFYQKVEVLDGIDKNLDVSVYAKPQFKWWQMEEIRLGLEKGLDVSIYANSKFNFLQMKVIREGLEEGLDVSVYAKPENEFETMKSTLNKLRNSLEYEDEWESEP